jgi:hypothetical protein
MPGYRFIEPTIQYDFLCKYEIASISEINVTEYRRGNQHGQSRETCNRGYTRRRQTKQSAKQYVLDTAMPKQYKQQKKKEFVV